MATVRETVESQADREMEAEEQFDFLDMRPSDKGLSGILEMNPCWEQYAISLGLSIEQAKYYHEQQQEAFRGLLALKHWRDGRCGSSYPGTWRFLLDVMKDDLGPVVADKLRTKIAANKTWTLRGQPDEATGVELECISKLKEFYSEDSVIQDDLLEMNPELNYLPLSYVNVKENKGGAGGGEPVKYDDIVNTGQGSKRVLLQGNPGSGKSTTLRKICHDFAKSNLPPEIKVVVRVVLGELEEGSKPKMEDLMQTCISEVHSNLIEEITSFVREHKGEGILFLFDGFDELARDLQKKSLVADILNRKAYPKSSYIITSRPSATAQLPPQAVQQMDRVETQGFTENKMEQFIQQWFLTRPDTREKIIKIISANSKLHDMCRNPLTVLIACTIASEEQMLPDRMTVLLKSFMCLLGNSYLKKKDQEPSIVQWEDLEEQCSSFKELAELALHGFLKGQYVFTDRDSSLPHRPSRLDHMGLFRVTSQKKGGAVVKSYQFFHLIIQEFLSAYALSLKSSKDQTAFWGECLVKGPIIKTGDWSEDCNLSLYADRRFETIFQFYAGLIGLRDGSIQQLLFNTVDTNEGLVLDYHYPVTSERSAVVYESQNEEVAKQLFSLHNPSLTIGYCKQPQQWMWCLRHVSFSSLTAYSDYFGQVLPLELVKQLFDTNKDRLEEVRWKDLSEEDGGFPVEMTVKCTKLKVLEFSPDWDDVHAKISFSTRSFLNVLNKSTSLQTLSLEWVQLSDMDVETVVGDISGAIQQHKNLSDVRLEDCCDELTRGVVEGMWRKQTPQHQVPSSPECGLWDLVWDTLLESDGSLSLSVNSRKVRIEFKEQSLHVRGREISQKSLVKFLNKSTYLETLSLYEVQLSDMDVETVVGDISGAIQQLKNLSDVRLKECCDELTRGVVGGVVVSQCIQKFSFGSDFSERKYSEEVMMSLENIKNSKNLRNFTLYLSPLPSHYMASIVCGCFQSRTLEKLWIEEEKLQILVDEDIADGVDGELLSRLESAIRDNNTLRELHLNSIMIKEPYREPEFESELTDLYPPGPTSVAEAMLKGAARNNRLEVMSMRVPDTAELHKLVEEVREVNKKRLRLDVKYQPPQSHQQGDSGPLLPSQEIAPPSTPPKEPDELENDGEKGVLSVTTSEPEEEGENKETQSSSLTTSEPEEEGENKGTQSSSVILPRPEEGEEKVLEEPHSQPTLPLWSTQAQPFLSMPYRHVFHRPGLSPSLPLRGVPSPSTPPEKQPSLEDVD